MPPHARQIFNETSWDSNNKNQILHLRGKGEKKNIYFTLHKKTGGKKERKNIQGFLEIVAVQCCVAGL